MQITKFLGLALAGHASAQSLVEVLAGNPATAALVSALQLVNTTSPETVTAIAGLNNVTILAPSNDALSALLADNATAMALAADPGLLIAVLQYHILNGTYPGSAFTTAAQFVPTLLTDTKYANVTGGQRVEALVVDGKVNIITGGGKKATVTQADINFTGGVVHLIDNVLSVPMSDSATLVAANLTSVVGALTKANLVSTVDGLKDVTIFIPSNEAFAAIGNIAGNISVETLTSVLQYHVVAGTVGYSTALSNTTIKTVGGSDVTIRLIGDNVFVNSAKVVKANVLVSNGVVHIIDGVLNPGNATATPNPTATAQEPAFSGASSTGTSRPTSVSQAVAPAMRTAAVGAAALFGGAAALLNL